MTNDLGLAPMRSEGSMIDPDTLGSVETPEREAELRAYYDKLDADDAAFKRSLRGRWADIRSRVRRAWYALMDIDNGL